jgi:hypothetical protein
MPFPDILGKIRRFSILNLYSGMFYFGFYSFCVVIFAAFLSILKWVEKKRQFGRRRRSIFSKKNSFFLDFPKSVHPSSYFSRIPSPFCCSTSRNAISTPIFPLPIYSAMDLIWEDTVVCLRRALRFCVYTMFLREISVHTLC